MTKVRIPYVHEYTDVRGKLRRQFRRKGFRKVNLPGAPGSPEFMVAYQAAMMQSAPEIGASKTKAGSINDVIVKYYGSSEWSLLASSTKATYRGILERFRTQHGDKLISSLKREHINSMVDKRAGKPAAAKNFLRMVRMLMAFAVSRNMRSDNPADAVKAVKYKTQGFHSWTEEEIALYEAKHRLGTRANLALSLLLYTVQRRSDVIRMGRQHIRNGVMFVRQQKTGAELHLPVVEPLVRAIEACPSDHLTFLTTAQGKPFTPAGFGNWFRDCCNEAGLPERCAAHGLRKAGCRRLAEAGMSANQIMSISGHVTLKEVATYTKAAEQRKLAESAMRGLVGPQREQGGG